MPESREYPVAQMAKAIMDNGADTEQQRSHHRDHPETTTSPGDDLTFRQLAELLDVTKRSVRRWYREGKLPTAHLDADGVWKVGQADVEALRRSTMTEPVQAPPSDPQTPTEQDAENWRTRALIAEGDKKAAEGALAEARRQMTERLAEWGTAIEAKDEAIAAQERSNTALIGQVEQLRRQLAFAQAGSVIEVSTTASPPTAPMPAPGEKPMGAAEGDDPEGGGRRRVDRRSVEMPEVELDEGERRHAERRERLRRLAERRSEPMAEAELGEGERRQAERRDGPIPPWEPPPIPPHTPRRRWWQRH